MKYLLDTNICIYIIKNNPLSVRQQFQSLSADEVGVSSITVAELQYGVQKSQHVERNQHALSQFLLPLEIARFDEKAAVSYGVIRAKLEAQGEPIGSLDTLIGAHALSIGCILVTNNLSEFIRVPQLQVENWI